MINTAGLVFTSFSCMSLLAYCGPDTVTLPTQAALFLKSSSPKALPMAEVTRVFFRTGCLEVGGMIQKYFFYEKKSLHLYLLCVKYMNIKMYLDKQFAFCDVI